MRELMRRRRGVASGVISPRPFTYAMLCRMPEEEGVRYEIYDGQLVVMPSPSNEHQSVVLNLAVILRQWVRQRALGQVLISPMDVVLERQSVCQPDVMFIAKQRKRALLPGRDSHVMGSPDLAVEVISRSKTRDRKTKFELYARFGVPHYWIVDPRERTLDAFGLEDGAYSLAAEHRGRQTFRPALFPGLKIPLPELWRP